MAAELIGIPLGTMGAAVYQAKITLSTADLFAWILVIVLLSSAYERIVLALSSRISGSVWRMAIPKARKGPRSAPRCTAPHVSIRRAQARFARESAPLFSVSCELEPGNVYVLNQPSGSGKTTFLRTVMGIESLSQGTIVMTPAREEIAMSAMFQNAVLFEALSAVENVRLFAGKAMDDHATRKFLEQVLEPDSLDRPVSQLSGGQKRRVELCRALAVPSSIVVLDEPFAGLDAATARRCARLLAQEKPNRIILVATHCTGPLGELEPLNVVALQAGPQRRQPASERRRA